MIGLPPNVDFGGQGPRFLSPYVSQLYTGILSSLYAPKLQIKGRRTGKVVLFLKVVVQMVYFTRALIPLVISSHTAIPG